MSIIDQLKKLSKDTFSYGFSSALQKLITIFLFPIYARLLSPTDFGIQDLIQTTVFIFSLFLILGMDSAVMQYYYEAEDEEKPTIMSSYLWFELLVSIPIIAVVIVFAEPISMLIFNNNTLANYLRIGVSSIPFSLIVGAMLSTLRLTFQTKKFVLLTTIGVLLQVSFAILFVIIFKHGVSGVLLSVTLSYFFQTLLGLFLTYKNYKLAISFHWIKKLLRIGIPFIPAALSYWMMGYANRFFLVGSASLDEIGLLSVVNRVSSILMLFLTAFSSAWGPYAYSIATDKEVAREMYSKVLTYLMLFSMTAAVGLSIYARELILLFATAVYEKGAPLVIIFSLSSISWMVLYIVGMGTGMAKKNQHYTLAVVLGAVTNTLMNYFLIPKLGVTGAAYATLGGNLVSLVYMYYAGQHYFRVNYELLKILKIMLLSTFCVLGGILLDRYFEVWTLSNSVYKTLLLLTYIVLLFVVKVVDVKLLKQGFSLMKGKFLVK